MSLKTATPSVRSRSQPDALAGYIDHTLLKADATAADVRRVCTEARDHGFATVCLNGSWIPLAAECLRGSGVLPISVVGFPLGAGASHSKASEAREAIEAGAREIDMVIHLGALKSRDYIRVSEDIRAVVEASRPVPVKVIIETGVLTREERIIACGLVQAAGAAFVKTSTGFSPGGATVEDIALMRLVVGPEFGIKASGGVRTREDAERMIAAGATRLGASGSVAIVSGDPHSNSAGSY